ncbi:ferredoxin [Actinoplanes solisilvae]|uniref:ferredoxin n=1 Tax=Actinoplanes solisilvae TaxID=2486853 RepID=UPI000FD6DC3A|nr:ferredoxin [Actinoplanes solisilvae]
MSVRITVDMNLCESHGQCVFVAPDVFWFDEDEILNHKPKVDSSEYDRVVAAAAACPVRAIQVSKIGEEVQ